MRILIFSESTNIGGIGGGEIITYHLINALSSNDHQVLMICNKKVQEYLNNRGISLSFENYIFDTLINSSNNILRFFSILFSLLKIIKLTIKFRPDIIFVTSTIATPVAYFIHIVFRTPIILNKISLQIGPDLLAAPSSLKIYALIEKFILKFFNFNLIISGGDFFLPIYKKLSGSSRCTIIPHPLDLNKFHPISENELNINRRKLGIDSKAKVIVFIGRLIIEKGVMDLLRAFKIIVEREKDFILLLVGGGNTMNQVKYFVELNNLEAQIKIFGVVPNAKVPFLLQVSDIFVLPSYNEVSPITAIEAMACGIPVVGTLIPAFEELYNNKSVVLVPPKNPEALAEAIISLFKDRNRMKRLGKENLKIAEKNSYETWSKKIIESFNSIL